MGWLGRLNMLVGEKLLTAAFGGGYGGWHVLQLVATIWAEVDALVNALAAVRAETLWSISAGSVLCRQACGLWQAAGRHGLVGGQALRTHDQTVALSQFLGRYGHLFTALRTCRVHNFQSSMMVA